MTNIIGTNGNDSLLGSYSTDTINGLAGNDTISGSEGDDTLTGGGGNDEFVLFNGGGNTYYITDFGGVGKGTNPTATGIAEVDTLEFSGDVFTARNLLLTQNGSNLEITFEGDYKKSKVILQNFALENLDNLSKSTGATVDLGNILFDGQTSITDSFDVFNANSTQSNIFNKNTVTFLNDLDNNVSGFDNSDDVINGQGGDDRIDGLSGNDLLRGGAGNDRLGGYALTGNNLLSGDDGNDFLAISGHTSFDYPFLDPQGSLSIGNNTLNGGAGDDSLGASGSTGNNLLSGDDGNDILSISGHYEGDGTYIEYNSITSGNNTLNGGAGNDTLRAGGSAGNNLLSGGDGNDFLDLSGDYSYTPGDPNDLRPFSGTIYNSLSTGNNTLNGGAGDDTIYGGSGNNTFVFNSFNEGIDSLYDFSTTNDLIQVSAAGFGGGLSSGSLKATQFTIGTSATTSEERFIYNSATGGLFFDLDGSASGFTQVQFAVFTTGLSLTNNNFVVV